MNSGRDVLKMLKATANSGTKYELADLPRIEAFVIVCKGKQATDDECTTWEPVLSRYRVTRDSISYVSGDHISILDGGFYGPLCEKMFDTVMQVGREKDGDPKWGGGCMEFTWVVDSVEWRSP